MARGQRDARPSVFTEKSGVNAVVIDSTDSFKAMCFNLAFSLALYTGQMCTTPQNLFIPRDGIETDDGHKSVDDVVAGHRGRSRPSCVGDDARAVELLGGVVNDGVLERLDGVPAQRRRRRASSRARSPTRHSPTPSCARPPCVARRRRRRDDLRAGVLRPGQLPHHDRRRPHESIDDFPRDRAWSTAR